MAIIVFGRSKTTLAPKENITRAEAAVIIRRLLQQSGLI
ncbi:S-layer homology domain-containing protein [Lutispora thermophila]